MFISSADSTIVRSFIEVQRDMYFHYVRLL